MSNLVDDLPIRVIKLGGSLLDLPDLAERFQRWRSSQMPACDVVVVGGGPAVERLRELQPQRGLDDESMHWLAIGAMSQNAATVVGLLSGAQLTDDLTAVATLADNTKLTVFDAGRFLRNDRGADALPSNWGVTSDSIAARVAIAAGADELVLLKSTLPEPLSTLAELSPRGYVDRRFAATAADIPSVRFVDLRSGSNSASADHSSAGTGA